MKHPNFLLFIGWVVGAIGVAILLNMFWVGYIHTPAKMESEKTFFILSNSLLASILVISALVFVKIAGRKSKADPGTIDPESGLREEAYRIWRRMPIRERAIFEIKGKFPEMTEERISEAITKAEALNMGASMEAEKFRSKAVTKNQGISGLAKNHPGFPKSLYHTAWSHGMQDTR